MKIMRDIIIQNGLGPSHPYLRTKQKHKTMKNTKKVQNIKGFSLVEMLVVIAVIGIIAAIAVPQIGRINDSAQDAKNRRNAQNIASVFASAQAAGLDFFVAGDEAATIAAVVLGATVVDEGPFEDTFFGVPNLSAAEQAAAAPFLEMDEVTGMIRYVGL